MISPLVPSFEAQRPYVRTYKPKHLILATPPPRPDQEYNVHRILDGSTLCERDPPIPEETHVDTHAEEEEEEIQLLPAPSHKDVGLVAARSIIRPLSTPPATSGTKQVERVRRPYCVFV